jgi:hypothetical protein
MKNGRLVLGGNNKNVGAAYYELQMGNVFYDLTENDKPIELKYNEKVIIKPGHRVVLITKVRNTMMPIGEYHSSRSLFYLPVDLCKI